MITPPDLMASVDPGLRATSVAIFERGVMVRCGLIKNPEKTQRGPGAWRAMAKATAAWIGPDVVFDLAVFEGQQIYRGAMHVNPDNVLQVTGVNGALSMGIKAKAYVDYLPRIWKRQVGQSDMADDIAAQITAAEEAAIESCAASLKHNNYHAIGVGLYHLGRLDTTRAR